MIKYLFAIFSIFLSLSIKAQTDVVVFNSPIKFPIRYAGNFGEIRPDHFHTGVDIKTQGAKGKGLYSIDKGYVSRIKVDLWGYGRTVYVNHPNGYTSVYAHLNKFSNKIAAIVKEAQYDQQTYNLDLYFYKNQIPISRSELLGTSGNSGNSFGPHLHFELRDTKTEYALNPYLHGFSVVDNIAPEIYNFAVYALDSFSLINELNKKLIIKAKKISNKYSINDTIIVSGNIGFGVSTYDFINGVPNKFAPYSISLYVDSVLYMETVFDKFDFYDKRYINSYIDYEEYYKSKNKIHRLFIEPNNKAKIYSKSINNGVLNFYEEGIHHIKIIIKDYSGNTSVLESILISKKHIQRINIIPQDNCMSYYKDNKFSTYDVLVTIPNNALYSSINFEYSTKPKLQSTISKIHIIHKPTVPLHKKYEIGINIDSIPKKYLHKAVIIRLHGKKIISNGGEIKGNYIFAKTYKFGSFAIALDTLAPVIKPINIYEGANINKNIKFKISDNLSGITKINGFIDNKWVCFEYDPKYENIVYYLGENIDLSKTSHKLRLEIEDERKNISIYEVGFFTK